MVEVLRHGMGARPGDIVVGCLSHAAGCWSLSRHPGPPQTWAPPDDALRLAEEFAISANVDVWLRDGDTYCVVERHRSRQAMRAHEPLRNLGSIPSPVQSEAATR